MSNPQDNTSKTEIVETIGDNIRRIRREQELKASELAHIVGCHEATITKYEIGKVNIPIMTLERLADSLGVSLSDLLEKTTETQKEEKDN